MKFFSLWHGVEMSFSDVGDMDEVGISFTASSPPNFS
jgi:hypothetical protein